VEENKPINNEEEVKQPNNEQQLNPSSTDEPILPAETTAESETLSTINHQPSTPVDMEVHHHAHDPAAPHHKKNWKSYFWEFLMLFLAVFCGFLAEYQLEQTIERHKEKDFIVSMIEDAQKDTAKIHEAIRFNEARMVNLDKLALICFNYKGTQKERTQMYYAQRGSIFRPDFVYPTERTLYQLKSSGGMRLIRKKKSAESIIEYDNHGKALTTQQISYQEFLNEITQSSSRLMNFSILFDTKKPREVRFDSATLLKPDEERLMDMGNKSLMFKGVLSQYVIYLKEMENGAIELMNTLRNDYHIE
jgi:hypothetical protein